MSQTLRDTITGSDERYYPDGGGDRSDARPAGQAAAGSAEPLLEAGINGENAPRPLK
jgi:hypothetical protein